MKKISQVWVAMAVMVLVFAFTPNLVLARDTVRIGVRYDPTTVNMLELKLGSDFPVIMPMHAGLMGIHPETGERVNVLAESIEIINDKDIKIKLIETARFHNGTKLTAHDVKWTYEQCANPKNSNIMAGPLDEIEEIEVVDDYNLVMRLWEPYAPWQELLWIGICSKDYFEEVGLETFRKNPIGSGPFRFVDRKIGESVTLEIVKDYPQYQISAYHELKPEYKRLIFVTVPDDVTRLAMLETGELDFVFDVLPHQLKRLKKNSDIKIKVSDQVPSLIGLSASPNTDPIMSDRFLGQAIRHAINRQEIVDKIFLGQGYPMYMFASRSELGYDPDFFFDFNPEKAKELLKKSAYKSDKVLTLTYTNLVPNSALVAAVIQKYLQDVGIKTKLQQLEEGVTATYVRNRDPRMGHLRLYSWAGGRDPNIRILLTLMSDSPYATVTNRPRKKEMDALCKAQAKETDSEKRLEILQKIHGIIAEDAVGTFLFGLNMIYAMRSDIDYTWTPGEAFPFHLQRIRVEK
ncbi:extracellular solute-binding protein family 5 [Desulfatibacillum aliphaticivorans]|uniref:Extracellular solute-binding protein family 5 n=1 Tax=Desulfatibacillum aliphaticivorans TaxID=218208 RepID=B8F8T2_DESAL|nr:ABC transporter substrate-binding protein [Desulfatibacillum aliphaticivorans]ACL01964.1 extracellular solute-binding protein family 5 [Desulfatibacillum aliphaticivorans]